VLFLPFREQFQTHRFPTAFQQHTEQFLFPLHFGKLPLRFSLCGYLPAHLVLGDTCIATRQCKPNKCRPLFLLVPLSYLYLWVVRNSGVPRHTVFFLANRAFRFVTLEKDRANEANAFAGGYQTVMGLIPPSIIAIAFGATTTIFANPSIPLLDNPKLHRLFSVWVSAYC
jgi:hypothetical protein